MVGPTLELTSGPAEAATGVEVAGRGPGEGKVVTIVEVPGKGKVIIVVEVAGDKVDLPEQIGSEEQSRLQASEQQTIARVCPFICSRIEPKSMEHAASPREIACVTRRGHMP